MKNYRALRFWLLLVLVAAYQPYAQAQNPRFDPAFQPTELYRPGAVQQVVVQSDGKVLLVGDFTRINGSFVPGLARLLPNGQLDAPFEANVAGLVGYASALALLPNGKILLSGSYLQLGGITRRAFLLLNADGTPDAGFDIGTGATFAAFLTMVGQPDGKILVAGYIAQFNGRAVGNIVRLNANGTLDTAFVAAGAGLNDLANDVAVQPDGKILVAGSFTTVHGANSRGLTRLLPSGARDTAFAAAAGTIWQGYRVGLLPNGRIMLLALRPGSGPVASFSAWPVPAHGELHVRFDSPQPTHQLELLDVLGHTVLRRTVAGATATVPLTGIAPGVYLLRYAAPGEASGSRRVVVE